MERNLLALAIAGLSMSSAHGLTYTVTEENDNGLADTQGTLSYAIRQANTQAGDDIIDIQTDMTVTAPMHALVDSNIEIQGNGFTLSGGRLHRPLFIKSGSVSISDLTIEDGLAKGQNTQWAAGAGAGLGGGLFIYDGDVEITDVTFKGNRAFGGSGNQRSGASNRSGGGMQKTKPESNASVDLFASSQFGTSLFGDGGYGSKHGDSQYQASGNYGGAQTTTAARDGGFGAGGRAHETGGIAGNGGFGAGGGYGYAYGSAYCGENTYACGTGGDGGFGGGGGYGGTAGGKGGFGAGGGGAYYGGDRVGGFGTQSSRYDGAGMGGAIFVRAGQLSLTNVAFESNSAYGGYNHPDIVEVIVEPIDGPLLVEQPMILERKIMPVESAAGYGGALFVMHTLENGNGNDQGMPSVLPTVSMCNVTFSDEEGTLNYASHGFNEASTSNVFDAGGRVLDSSDSFNFSDGETLTIDTVKNQEFTTNIQLVNCSGETLDWSISIPSEQGQVGISQSGELTYKADAEAEDEDGFVISVSDGNETKTLNVVVNLSEPSDSSGGSLFWILGGLLPFVRRRR